jgi:hypothetical protein
VTATFLALLIVSWIAVFLPAALRAKHSNPLVTSNRWRKRMSVIAPAGMSGRWVVVPRPREEGEEVRSSYYRSQRQRRHLFIFLIAATVVSGTFAVALRTPSLWEVHLAFAGSLALYVLLLIRVKRQRVEQARKVESLRTRRQRSSNVRLDDAVGYFANRRA